MWSPRNCETAQAKNFKTEAVIKIRKSLNLHLLQQVGKCNLFWETSSTATAPWKEMKLLLQPLKSIFPHLVFQARVFWLTQKRVHCSPCLPLTALQQRIWTSYKPSRHWQRSTGCPSSPTKFKEGQTNLCHQGMKEISFLRAHCPLTVSPFIYWTA